MRSLTRSTVLLASLALPLAFTSTALATSSICDAVPNNIVTNCGFETGDFTGWTVYDPSSPTNPYANTYVDSHFPNSGNDSANLGAVSTTDKAGNVTYGTLSQTLTDTTGALYTFTFYLQNEIAVDSNGNPYPGGNAFGVSVLNASNTENVLLAPASVAQSNSYALYSFTFVGSGTDTIQFNTSNVPSYYNLDDVVVDTPTPEPSSLALMGTGALLFAAITRRSMKSL